MPPLTLLLLLVPAETPAAVALFPAGGRRGTSVPVRVAGLNLHERCGWELAGKGLTLSKHLTRTRTRWFEGPILPLPDSQRQEDYPQDMAGSVAVAKDAPLGPRRLRLWTSEGAAAGPIFVVGDLPEVVEEEIDGDPVPVRVTLPVTINGRIFPREDVDDWTFDAKKGQSVTAEVHAARIGSKLDSRLELFGPDGEKIAENDDAIGTDSLLRFTAAADGVYRLRISDSARGGSQAHVYRLTVTAGPFVDHAYPAGGRIGAKTKFALVGANLPAADVELTLPASPHGFALDADTLPEFLEGAGTFTTPGILNGRIGKPGEVDAWTFDAKKAQTLEIELRPIGSPLLPRLTVEDGGKPVFALSGTRGLFTPSKDGSFTLRVRDQFARRGGPAFLYRIRVAPAVPDFRLSFPVAAERVLRKGDAKLKVEIDRRGGFNEPVTLTVAGLPKGVTALPVIINPGQPRAEITLKATDDATLGPVRMTVAGKAKILTRTTEDDLLLGVGLKAPFKYVADYDSRIAPRGSTFKKTYRIEREPGFTGPLEARLGDHQNRHLQGVTGPAVAIAADSKTFEFGVDLPPSMEIGRTSRSVIVLVGKVKVDGVEHAVSYGAEGQNDQLIAVVETGRLGLELLEAGTISKAGDVPFRVRRGKDVAGPVAVSLDIPAHVKGVECAPVTLAAGVSSGKLSVILKPGAGPFTMPLTVRATLAIPGDRMAAEALLHVVKE